jgi:hypothetical protein
MRTYRLVFSIIISSFILNASALAQNSSGAESISKDQHLPGILLEQLSWDQAERS